jgi:dTDP-glucose 4,6-dehydratase
VPIYGDGMNVRDWLFVDDHCEAIDLVYHNGRIGETYLVGGDCEMPNLGVAFTILSTMNKSSSLVTFVKDRKGHDLKYAIDFSKISNELGWFPKTSFVDGIHATLKWYGF